MCSSPLQLPSRDDGRRLQRTVFESRMASCSASGTNWFCVHGKWQVDISGSACVRLFDDAALLDGYPSHLTSVGRR